MLSFSLQLTLSKLSHQHQERWLVSVLAGRTTHCCHGRYVFPFRKDVLMGDQEPQEILNQRLGIDTLAEQSLQALSELR